MKQSEKSLKYIYLKQIAETIKQFRRIKGLTQTKLGNNVGVDPSSISQWETELYYPTASAIEKLEKYGISFTQEQKDAAKEQMIYKVGKHLTWEEKFDRTFTRAHNTDNAPGYNGDDWKVGRDRQPIKPSVIKEFIKEVVLKGGVKVE